MSTTSAAPASRPTLLRIGEGHYWLEADAQKCCIEATQVRRDRNSELRATIEVRTALAGALVLDQQGTLNRYEGVYLGNPVRRREVALDLSRRAKTRTGDVDWQSLLDDLAFQLGRAEAIGEGAVLLQDVPPSPPASTHVVAGFPLLRSHPQILFGDGGSLKSFTMLFLAGELARLGHRPMYCDWELEASDHRERASALWGDDVPGIVYVRCNRPLVAEVERLARLRHEHAVDFAFFDSVAFACHGKPEDADVAASYYRAVRSLGIGTLHAAHIPKGGDNAEQRPFGSTFWHNGARATWFAKAEDEHVESNNGRTVAFINRKTNLHGRHPSLAYRFEFDGGRVRIAPTDPTLSEDISGALPAWQRIKATVSGGPRSVAEISAETGLREDTVRRTVSRRGGMFMMIGKEDGARRVALLDTRRVS